ncbi:hypothetical protein RRF57_009020 [Xylaria bambusicola]|uniref:Dynamin N-terminal domain-containing protein n=1 Tax=Xylaria bambusicola TaxID=326684 RepID=A0AAN7ZBN6_9PEZI
MVTVTNYIPIIDKMPDKTIIHIKVENPTDHQMPSPTSNKSDFAWVKCSEADAHRRLLIKEHSLEVGLKYCEKLVDTIEGIFTKITNHSKQSAENTWPLEDRNDWIAQCRSIVSDHKAFQVFVGVAGATGSGKTSILNALLGFQELLPTNNEEASTAVQCKVSFNHDERTEYAFRCHVTFQSKETLTARLKRFFADIMQRDEFQEQHDGSIENEDALRDIERALRPTAEMISILFNLQEDQAKNLELEGVLNSNPEVLNLLGTVKEINCSEAADISRLMKPYMDSTIGDHSVSGARFAMWPIIEKVELFIKSDILRNGVVLVDLPGLGDAVQSRESVAEGAFEQLTATLIVAQATRAADNSTAVNLMSRNHEMAMMLNGKFHKRSFCVCLSQIDLIDRRAALRKPDAKANDHLRQLLTEEEAEKSKLKEKGREKSMKKKTRVKLKQSRKRITKQKLDSATMATTKAKLKAAEKDTLLELAKISKEITNAKSRLVKLESEITFACIQARNRFVRERIKSDFQKRQARLIEKFPGMRKTYDGEVSVCPTSSAAFWKCKCALARTPGFPTESYTGIPGLAAWVRGATMQKREEHVDDFLSRLQAQYNTILLWSEDKQELKDTSITKESFEKDILAGNLKQMEQELAVYWSSLKAEVDKRNPLNGKQDLILSKCPQMCVDAVRGWAYKKPEDRASDKVHYCTYQANLSRSGGKFVSKSKETFHEFNWMEDISHLLFNTIVADWNQSLNHDIPSLADAAWLELDTIWDRFMANLNENIHRVEPRLLTELANQKLNLEVLKTNAKLRVQHALKRISQNATQFHPKVVSKIQSEWQNKFEEALEITGSGAYMARQQLLLDFAQENSKRIFRTVYKDLKRQLQKGFDQLPRELADISHYAVKGLQRYLRLILDKVLGSPEFAVKSAALAEEKLRLKESVISALGEWTAEWRSPSLDGYVNDKQIDSIPEEYRHARTELEIMEADNDYLDSDSDSNSVSDTDDNDPDLKAILSGEVDEEMVMDMGT